MHNQGRLRGRLHRFCNNRPWGWAYVAGPAAVAIALAIIAVVVALSPTGQNGQPAKETAATSAQHSFTGTWFSQKFSGKLVVTPSGSATLSFRMAPATCPVHMGTTNGAVEMCNINLQLTELSATSTALKLRVASSNVKLKALQPQKLSGFLNGKIVKLTRTAKNILVAHLAGLGTAIALDPSTISYCRPPLPLKGPC